MGLGGRMTFISSPDIGWGSRVLLFSPAWTLGPSTPVRRSAGDEKNTPDVEFWE